MCGCLQCKLRPRWGAVAALSWPNPPSFLFPRVRHAEVWSQLMACSVALCSRLPWLSAAREESMQLTEASSVHSVGTFLSAWPSLSPCMFTAETQHVDRPGKLGAFEHERNTDSEQDSSTDPAQCAKQRTGGSTVAQLASSTVARWQAVTRPETHISPSWPSRLSCRVCAATHGDKPDFIGTQEAIYGHVASAAVPVFPRHSWPLSHGTAPRSSTDSPHAPLCLLRRPERAVPLEMSVMRLV